MESISPQRRGAGRDNPFFSLPLRRRQRKIIMPFGQGLISSDNLHEAGGEKNERRIQV